MTRIIVCDTGPLLHLSEAGASHLLSLAGEILIPPMVVIEFKANTQGWSPPQWARKVALEKSAQKKAENGRKKSRLMQAKQKPLVWLCRNRLIGC